MQVTLCRLSQRQDADWGGERVGEIPKTRNQFK